MGIKRIIDERLLILKGYLKSFDLNRNSDNEDAVDFVVSWVDGNDPEWLKQREQSLGNDLGKKEDNHKGRYQAWDCFRYWFRGVETFAPWVRKVFLVTWGHVPEWLNEECPKLQIVKHEEFIPAEYLPTFNSNTIEMNLFRIPGLSDNFVYFNDDMFLCRPVKKTEFFYNSKPKLTAIAWPWVNRDRSLPYYLFYNVYGEINRLNSVSACIQKSPEKWFSHLYGRSMFINKYPLQMNVLPGMFFTHMGVPFSKTSMQETWNKYQKACEETCSYKQRDVRQITHHIFSVEDMLKGEFYPSGNDWGYEILITDTAKIDNAFKSRKKKMFCLFDGVYSDEQTEVINRELNEVFTRYLGEKSSFEK